MCGICGFTGARDSDADRATLKAMCDVMAHRGPDGEGSYIADGIALGHRRLALIDLAGGGQPMIRADRSPRSAVFSPAPSLIGVDGANVMNRRGGLPPAPSLVCVDGPNAMGCAGAMASRGRGRSVARRVDGLAPRERDGREVELADGANSRARGVRVAEGPCADGAAKQAARCGGGASNLRSWAARDGVGLPGACARGDFVIVFNGEIYNYRELRDELRRLGFSFSTDSDTEVLLVGYIAWGEGVLDRLRGMFAFALYDAAARELFCARDPFGIKPFYYALQGGQFIFASEVKGILKHPAYERGLNGAALAQYLRFQFSALDETLFSGVFKLPGGHFMRVRDGDLVEIVRYWRPKYAFDEGWDDDAAAWAVDAAVRESVRYHNVADVEVGSFLSSGIDSSYLAACLARENPSVKTFTVGFSEYAGERDEVSWARELAGRLGVENDAERIGEQEYWDVLPRVQWHLDEPSADPSAVALYFVDRLAARKVKAVLSGEGADELFGGYRVYQASLIGERLAWLPKVALRAGSRMLRAVGAPGANFLERASGQVEDWYYTNANGVAFSPLERDRILTGDLRELAGGLPAPQQLVAPAYAEVAGLDAPARMQRVDLSFWLAGDILLKTDKMAMAHSLESRVPFLDRGVFDVAATVPLRQRVSSRQTKIALRRAAERAIPREWAQKEKLGFPVPIAGWLRQERRYSQVRDEFTGAHARELFDAGELVRLLDAHRVGKVDFSRRIWIVYSLLVWHRVFFVDA